MIINFVLKFICNKFSFHQTERIIVFYGFRHKVFSVYCGPRGPRGTPDAERYSAIKEQTHALNVIKRGRVRPDDIGRSLLRHLNVRIVSRRSAHCALGAFSTSLHSMNSTYHFSHREGVKQFPARKRP